MNNLVINSTSQKRLDILKEHLPQSLLLGGESGVGLLTIARELASKQLVAVLQPQDAKEQIDAISGTITVEMIRRLYDQTRARHTSRRIVIIDDADRTSLGAQSAFLKLLEEPNTHIYFILTSHAPGKLLPTIQSRVQHITIYPASHQQTSDFIEQLGVKDPVKKAQLHFIADGLPAEILRLINDEDYFKERAKIMTDAKLLIQSNPYDQLLILQRYQSDRVAALKLIDSALLVARRSLSAKPQPGLVKQLEKLLDIQDNIQNNYSVRLQLTRYMLT
jgi:DNA polymerase III delta prime subunit